MKIGASKRVLRIVDDNNYSFIVEWKVVRELADR